MSIKQERRNALIAVIQSERIDTQSELVAKIAARGFHATQTTISRDIESLKVVKGPKGYELPADLLDISKWKQSIKDHGVSVDCVGEHLLVLHTKASTAQMIANAIDHESIQGVAGTIAGDDTIFIALQNRDAQKHLAAQIMDLLE
ncbi:MAG: ArgR family transcriptional regulator [Deltaproteobacteria bacterium]|nr:ArgR family transcriptional regulator [Deltaproteobacteria bacterium]